MIRINPVLIHLQSFITEMVDFPVGTLKTHFLQIAISWSLCKGYRYLNCSACVFETVLQLKGSIVVPYYIGIKPFRYKNNVGVFHPKASCSFGSFAMELQLNLQLLKLLIDKWSRDDFTSRWQGGLATLLSVYCTCGRATLPTVD